MTGARLKEIEERNRARKEAKKKASPGPWTYDSFAFINIPETVPRNKRTGILVRTEKVFDSLGEQFGKQVLDQGVDYKNMLQVYDAKFIVEARNDGVEGDVEDLIAEVKRLRSALVRFAPLDP